MLSVDQFLGDVEGGRIKKYIIFIVAVVYTLFHLWTAGIGDIPSLIQASLHVGLGLTLVYLLFPSSKTNVMLKTLDYVLLAVAVIACSYVVLNYQRFIMDPFGYGTLDIVIGTLFVVIILDSARRTVGWIVPVVALLMLAYTSFGQLIPGKWGHNGLQWDFIVSSLYMTSTGIFGQIVLISATTVAIFLIFGAALEASGGTESFNGISIKLTGRAAGGAAKMTVLSGALFGTISGNTAANVAVSGNFTIPLMKKLKYPAHYAAAVEASSSTLGQIMPPIMGASAFIMAQYLAVSYFKIVLAAIIPALLFTLGIYMTIHFDAKRRHYETDKSEASEQLSAPSWRELLGFQFIGTVLIPILVLLFTLSKGYTIELSCFYSIVVCLVLFLLQDLKWARIKKRLSASISMLTLGAKSLATIVPMIACAQIIVALLGKTGLGVKIGNLIVSLGGQSLLLSLFAAMGLALILGMGVPTTAAYVLGASMAAPALIKLGVLPIAAHFFVLYYAVVSAITPPICTGIFIAAGMAKANWFKAALSATRQSFAAFIVPFSFVYHSGLLLGTGFQPIDVFFIISTIAGVICFSAGTSGYLLRNLNALERILYIIISILMIVPVLYLSIIGVSIFAVLFLMQLFQLVVSRKASRALAEERL